MGTMHFSSAWDSDPQHFDINPVPKSKKDSSMMICSRRFGMKMGFIMLFIKVSAENVSSPVIKGVDHLFGAPIIWVSSS